MSALSDTGLRRLLHIVVLLLGVLAAVRPAVAQQPVLVDPYEVLYGKRLPLPQKPIPEPLFTPSKDTIALVSTRSEALLTRARAMTAMLGTRTSRADLQDIVTDLNEATAQVDATDGNLRPFARAHSISALFLIAEIWHCFGEAIARQAMQEVSGASGSLSRLPELRAKLEAFHARIRQIKPQSVGTALAVINAHAMWVDLSSFMDLLQHRPDEISQLVTALVPVPPEKRDLMLRLFVEPLAAPIIEWVIGEADLQLQASLADAKTERLRIDERSLRELARSYREAAMTNYELLLRRAEGRAKPKRDKFDELLVKVLAVLLTQRLDYARLHREETGLDAAVQLLGVSLAAYQNSVFALQRHEIDTAPALWGDEERDTAEKAQAATRRGILADEYLSARRAAAQARNVVGAVPTPIGMDLQTGSELSSGDKSDQEDALEALIEARAMADLTVALVPVPGAVSREGTGTGISEAEQEGAVEKCIDDLQSPQKALGASAESFSRSRGWRVPVEELRKLVKQAVLDTCTRAKFLNDKVSSLFWRVLKNAYVDWLRDYDSDQRRSNKLVETCEDSRPNSEEEILGQEACTLRKQAMGQLTPDERTLLQWRYEEELTYSEIGTRLGNVSEEAARKRVKRTQARLRQIYLGLQPQSHLQPRVPAPWAPSALAFWIVQPALVSPNLRRELRPLHFF